MAGLCPFPNLRIREITPLRAASSIRLKKDPCTRREEVERTQFQTSIFTVEKKERVQTKLLVQTKEYHYRQMLPALAALIIAGKFKIISSVMM